jgi:hypothetical protein
MAEEWRVPEEHPLSIERAKELMGCNWGMRGAGDRVQLADRITTAAGMA